MADAIVIDRSRIPSCHETLVGFIRQPSRAVRRLRVKLSDISGIAVEEQLWFNDSPDTAALAEEVAEYISRAASERSDLETFVIFSDAA